MVKMYPGTSKTLHFYIKYSHLFSRSAEVKCKIFTTLSVPPAAEQDQQHKILQQIETVSLQDLLRRGNSIVLCY